MATSPASTSKGVAEQMAAMVVNMGGTAPASDGLGELWFDLATAQQAYLAPGTSLGIAPTGATGETIPRWAVNSATQAIPAGTTTSTLVLSAIYLPINTVVSNINFVTGTTGSTAIAFNWGALFNSARVLLATSANNTTDLGASTLVTYAIAATAAGVATSFTTTYSGLHYLGFLSASATTQPTMAAYVAVSGSSTTNGLAPKLCGLSTVTQSTVLTNYVTAQTAITAQAYNLYGFTS